MSVYVNPVCVSTILNWVASTIVLAIFLTCLQSIWLFLLLLVKFTPILRNQHTFTYIKKDY